MPGAGGEEQGEAVKCRSTSSISSISQHRRGLAVEAVLGRGVVVSVGYHGAGVEEAFISIVEEAHMLAMMTCSFTTTSNTVMGGSEVELSGELACRPGGLICTRINSSGIILRGLRCRGDGVGVVYQYECLPWLGPLQG